jgi:hypothetical protein
MDNQLFSKVSERLSADECVRKAVALQIGYGHLASAIVLFSPTPFDLIALKKWVAKALVVELIPLNEEQRLFLKENYLNFNLIASFKEVVSRQTDVSPANVVEMVIMLNQDKIVSADFYGGRVPNLEITHKSGVVDLRLLNGMGNVNEKCVDLLRSCGMKKVRFTDPLVLNFAYKGAMTGKFNKAQRFVDWPICPSNVKSLPCVTKGIVNTVVTATLREAFHIPECSKI